MTDTNHTQTPGHLWVIGSVAVLWNAMGLFDFVMTMTRNEAYLSGFTEEQLVYFYSFPGWVVALWGIAVIGGELGSVLLLARKSVGGPDLSRLLRLHGDLGSPQLRLH